MNYKPGDHCGRLVIQRRLGQGGMAQVFLGLDPQSGALYAIKTVGVGLTAEDLLRFQREAHAQAAADAHPNVLRVHAWQDDPRGACLVMEYAPGGDLEDRLRRGPLAPDDARVVVRDLARGLAHAHAQGVLHRDLKPGNVLFDERGTAKLSDFGLARLAGADSLTATGAVMGTPAYMAPEQADPSLGAADFRTDVYGLGAVLYACLTGVPPYAGGRGALSIMSDVVSKPVVPPRKLVPSVPKALEAVCLRCLAKKPGDRYPSGDALADALDVCANTAPPPAPPRALLAGIAATALLALAATAIWGGSPTEATVAPKPPAKSDHRPKTKAAPRPGRTAKEPRAPAPLIGVPAPFFRPLRDLVQPPLTPEELQQLEVWRALFAGGDWGGLGWQLDPKRVKQDRDIPASRRLTIACYLRDWRNGNARGMGRIGAYLVDSHGEEQHPAASASLGLECIRRAARRCETGAMKRLSDYYRTEEWRYLRAGLADHLEPDDSLAVTWTFLAYCHESRVIDRDQLEASFRAPPPKDRDQGWEWIAKAGVDMGEDPSRPLSDGWVAPEERARERVVALLSELHPITLKALRDALPEAGELTPNAIAAAMEDGIDDRGFYPVAKSYDPQSESEDPPAGEVKNLSKAGAWFLHAIERGDARALRSVGNHLTSSFEDPQANALGVTAALWAAFAGDTPARKRVAFFYERGVGVAPHPRAATAWLYLSTPKQRRTPAGLAGIRPDVEFPVSNEQAWSWVEAGLKEDARTRNGPK